MFIGAIVITNICFIGASVSGQMKIMQSMLLAGYNTMSKEGERVF